HSTGTSSCVSTAMRLPSGWRRDRWAAQADHASRAGPTPSASYWSCWSSSSSWSGWSRSSRGSSAPWAGPRPMADERAAVLPPASGLIAARISLEYGSHEEFAQTVERALARGGDRGATMVAYLDRGDLRSEEHTSELQSLRQLVCRL